MKLIVTGSTGFVATEIIRQSLHLPKITSVIAIARRQVSPPPDLSPSADTSKLRSVVVDDYGTYSDNVKAQLAGADACIWYEFIYQSDQFKNVSLKLFSLQDRSDHTRQIPHSPYRRGPQGEPNGPTCRLGSHVQCTQGGRSPTVSLHVHERCRGRARSNKEAELDAGILSHACESSLCSNPYKSNAG